MIKTSQVLILARRMHQHTSTFPISKEYLKRLREQYERNKRLRLPPPKPKPKPHYMSSAAKVMRYIKMTEN